MLTIALFVADAVVLSSCTSLSRLQKTEEESKGLPTIVGSGLVEKFHLQRNRRASASLSPVLIHFLTPHGQLYHRLLTLEHILGSIPPLVSVQQHPGPREPHYGIPPEEWPKLVRRVREQHEPLRQVVAEYGVSRETVRRLLSTAGKKKAG